MRTPTMTLSPAPMPAPTTTPTPTSTPRPTSTPTSTPSPTPAPTPTPIQKTENEIRETLISLGYQAMDSPTFSEQDAKLKEVVNESLSYGQLDLAFWAAKNGGFAANQSSMLAKVAECIAIEGKYELARRPRGSSTSTKWSSGRSIRFSS